METSIIRYVLCFERRKGEQRKGKERGGVDKEAVFGAEQLH